VVGYFISNNEVSELKEEKTKNEDIFQEEIVEQVESKVEEEVLVNNSDKEVEKQKINQIIVEIKGYVNAPNVYSMEEGSRLYDLIEMAGGFDPVAYTKNLHLAEKVYDEETIVVYSTEEAKALGESMVSIFNNKDSFDEANSEIVEGNVNTGNSNLVNINTADKSSLITLKGIGEVTADKIIEYRQQNGLFKSIEDVKNVSGIGDKTFLEFKDDITVK
jgi:competence protein ComEA